jgi:hypothetical protein
MKLIVSFGLASIFFYYVSVTKAEIKKKNLVNQIISRCTPQAQSSCDNSEQICTNMGIDNNKKIACCLQWKSCLNSIGCDTSMYRCE